MAPADLIAESHPLVSGTAATVLEYLLCQKAVTPAADEFCQDRFDACHGQCACGTCGTFTGIKMPTAHIQPPSEDEAGAGAEAGARAEVRARAGPIEAEAEADPSSPQDEMAKTPMYKPSPVIREVLQRWQAGKVDQFEDYQMYQDRTETIDEKSKSVKRCLRQKSLRGSVETVENEIAARTDAAKALSDAKTQKAKLEKAEKEMSKLVKQRETELKTHETKLAIVEQVTKAQPKPKRRRVSDSSPVTIAKQAVGEAKAVLEEARRSAAAAAQATSEATTQIDPLTSALKTAQKTSFLTNLFEFLPKYLPHYYLKHSLRNVYRKQKENLPDWTLLVLEDYAEEYRSTQRRETGRPTTI